MEHIHLHLLGGKLDKRVGKSLDRTVHVAFHNDIELLEVADGLAAGNIVESENLCCAQTLLAGELLALVGNLAGFLLCFQHIEHVAGGRSAVETQNQRRSGGAGLGDALVALVEHGLHLAEVVAREHYIAHMECAVLHKNVGHIAASLVERRFYDCAHGAAVGVSLEVEHLGFEKHFLHQFIHAYAFLGGDVLALVFAAPLFHQIVHGGEFFLDFVGIGMGLVDLIDGEHDGHACC